MKENYYEYLEISKNASQEIIEKAYKTLVRKYHPDLQQGEVKQEYEEKLKKINEAYEVLSDKTKKEAYDLELAEDEKYQENLKKDINYENSSTQENTNNIYKENLNNYKSHDNNEYKQNENYEEMQQEYKRKMEESIKKAYYDAYIQDLKNRGYKIRYKKTFKQYLRMLLSILIVAAVCFIIFQIPFVKNFFINIYNENIIIQYIVDLIIKIFNSIKAALN